MNQRHLRLLHAGILLALTLAVYAGGIGNGFLVNWDDPLYVTANPDIQSVTLDNLKRVFTSFYVGNYAPLQMLSYMFDYWLWGERPLAFLAVNVLLHGLNAILLYLLMCHLRLPSAWALCAAVLFAVHPGQVESVAWISQRKNVLAMSFFLASLWSYLSFTRAGSGRYRHYAASCLLFLAALLTKSVVVILPAVLLLYDVTLREKRGGWRGLIVEKVPYALLTLGTSWLAVISQRPEFGGGLVSKVHGGSHLATALTMLTVYKEYLFNLFWPLQLSAVYEVDIKTGVDAEVLWSAGLLLLSLGSLLLCRRDDRRSAAFWLGLFFLGFVPVLQIIPINTLMNDRYLYFPMLGFAGAFVLLLRGLADRSPAVSRFLPAVATGLVLFLGLVTWQRAGVWQSSVVLWQDTVAKQPDSAMAWKMLGNSYRKAGNLPAAIDSYLRSVAIQPRNYEHNYELGVLYHDRKDYPNAIRSYRNAFFLKPDHVSTLYNLGLVYTLVGEHAPAVEILSRGVRVSPESRDMWLLLAANHYYLGNHAAATSHYAEALRQEPGSPVVAGYLALVALRQGKTDASRRYLHMAMTAGASLGEVYLDWARLEAVGGRKGAALEWLAAALREGADPGALREDSDFELLKDDQDFRRLLGAEQ